MEHTDIKGELEWMKNNCFKQANLALKKLNSSLFFLDKLTAQKTRK
jgi:hypothetical protein